ncbi:MAG: site-2 protease family protein [Pirellulales bacterium]|nr:site-2 protease family protein [Pirellulales bacterium]
MDANPDFLALGVAWYAIFVVSTSLHEAAHAVAALRLGDPTAYYAGQVTPNPAPHMAREPFGMIVMPIASYLLSGWMIGWASAPYDPHWALRYPRRAALMALAGPLANLSLVLLAAGCIRLGLALDYFLPPERVGFTSFVAAADEGVPTAIATLLSIMLVLNLLLFVFNLLPVPPLDGAGVLALVLPARTVTMYQDALRQPAFGMIGLIVAWKLIDQVFWPALRIALKVVYAGVASY